MTTNWSSEEEDVFPKIEKQPIVGNRYKMYDFIGRGSFGKVYKVKDTTSDMLYAMKISKRRNDPDVPMLYNEGTSHECYKVAKHEVKILKLLNRLDPYKTQSIMRLYDTFYQDRRIFILVDLLSVNIYDFLVNNQYKPFPVDQATYISYQLCEAINFLHKNSIVHTDTKPENIMFLNGDYHEVSNPSSNNQTPEQTLDDVESQTKLPTRNPTYRILKRIDIKLIDFGSAVDISKSVETNFPITTRNYRSFEAVTKCTWGPPTDIWSVGCTIFEIFFGYPLFVGVTRDLDHIYIMNLILGPFPSRFTEVLPLWKLAKIHTKRIELEKDLDRDASPRFLNFDCIVPEFQSFDKYFLGPNSKPMKIYDLLLRMLQFDPEERLTAAEAIDDDAFKNVKGRLDACHGTNGMS